MIRTAGRRRTLAVLATLAAAALLLTGCTDDAPDARATSPAQAQGSLGKDITDRLSAALDNAVTLSGSSGAIAGVWAPWAGTWVTAVGTTSTDGSTKMSTDLRFRIGGTTETMTCSVLLQLVDKGTVQLEDPVTKYLKNFPGADGLTLGQLCQNTAGLGEYSPSVQVQFVNNPTRQWVPLELVSDALVSKHVAAPGKLYHPSAGSYVLLGMALEAASHSTWNELYHQYVFDRVGLQATTYPSGRTTEIGGAHPHGYAAELDRKTGHPVCTSMLDETSLSTSQGDVAGGVVSDLTDLKEFIQAVGQGTLISDAAAAEQRKTMPVGEDAPEWLGYGLGIMSYGPLIGHDGAIPGFLTVMLTEPTSGLTVVAMLNNSTDGPGFIRMLGLQLAAIAAEAPAASGSAPSIELPWTEEDTTKALTSLAVCSPEKMEKAAKDAKKEDASK